ncbi:replication initiator protein [Nocardia nova]|uniref:replication initiator n=1 Tax=Nocardia nova TaxID=37330 RepID=UPI0025AF1062|nr:replication initiator [Nocardia nova]MDN2497094.1 replication initiator protein [Nocardia nova]
MTILRDDAPLPNAVDGSAGRGPSFLDIAVATAERHGVCVRPVILEQTDLDTGRRTFVPVPCGATLESKCPPCARKHKALRQAQCREGWHLTEEPATPRPRATYDHEGLLSYRADLTAALNQAREGQDVSEVASLRDEIRWTDEQLTALGMRGKAPTDIGTGAGEDSAGSEEECSATRSRRSTRRRDDAPDLPRNAVSDRTVGREFGGHYSSMFVTLTMPSYGKVFGDGAAREPGRYDYDRAAWDAICCARLFSRWIQNLRRVVGWNVQYFAVVEPQKRGAPHLHIALRGHIPREVLRKVTEATYHQVWWPPTGEMRYPGADVPLWDKRHETFIDPKTRKPLADWDDAVDAIGPEDGPAHTARFGSRLDIQGIAADTDRAREAVGYLCKYLTKSVSEVLRARTARQHDHYDRLHAALCRTPCSPRCAIWLLYGVIPKGATAKTVPGVCKARAHRRETLALPGNRVLTSEKWTGKTLGDHKADRIEFVRRKLAAVGIDKPARDPRRYTWATVAPGTRMPSRAQLLISAIAERVAWRVEYDRAILAAESPPGSENDAGECVRQPDR